MRILAAISTAALLALAADPAVGAPAPVLNIEQSTAPVRTDVGYTIRITPTKQVVGKRARIQVKGITAWRGFDTFRIPKSGLIRDTVEGYAPGVGRYRVLILSNTGKVMSRSNTAVVTWTAKVN